MSANGAEQLVNHRTERLKWSSDVISDLLECKKRAQELASSEEPARNTNDRKKGYMKILKELWDDLGYAELKSNKKITKKGKKNRIELLRECRTLSVAVLVAYMEKQKSRLRKVKRGYWTRKKQEDARRLNAQFELDPGRVYSDFRSVIDDQG